VLRLEKRPMELLILLLEREGELVSRDEIAERLWGKDVFVDVEHGINTAVRKVRLALKDDSEQPRFVETVVGKGYRFAASVTCSGNGERQSAGPAKTEVQPRTGASIAPASTTAVVLRPHNSVSNRVWLFAAAGVLVVISVVVAFLFGYRVHPRTGAPPDIKSLAVLPLKNLSGDSSQEYLADGMTEALIGRLAAIHDLRVISRTSVMRLKDTQLSIPQIAKTLQVDALVEGSVIRQGNRIRITAQLIRGASDEHFWSETYDRDLPDVLALESDVAQAIARRVEATVTGREHERIVTAHPVSPDVYESYLRGRFILRSESNTRSGVEESIRYFQDAIQKDPTFAPAYVGISAAHSQLGLVRMNGVPDRERREVIEAARKALQLDPDLSEAHYLLAETAQKEWRWAEAEAEYRKALELNPSDADANAGLASWLMCQGREADAMNWAERGRQLDPLGFSGGMFPWILFQARRYDDAIRESRSMLAVRPDDAGLLWALGFVLVVKGQPEQAIPILEKASALSNRSSGVIDVLSAAYARGGRRNDALRIVAELKRRHEEGYVPPASFVIAYVGLGDKEQAFAWLEEAYKEKSNILQHVKVHPFLDPLRSDPRFTDLVRRVGLN
jgi:TolB-like protein/DNA-binding winged helix-turn-helix (wHTH) protein/Flp pilus assembly protein TadD